MTLSLGMKLGPYEIVAAIGAGGMGEVYRTHDSRLGRNVAIMVIPRGSPGDSERARRFEQEARAAGTLSHPNVCAVYDLGTHEGAPFVVAEGLAAAHAKGIIHRGLADAVLARHLEQNVLGDRYTEGSYVTEPVAHGWLPEPALANRYVEAVVAELKSSGT